MKGFEGLEVWRYYYQDNVRFCYNARGSLDETTNHLITARDLGYISESPYQEVRALADEVRRILNGYIAYLKRRRQGENEPGSNLAIHETRIAYAPSVPKPD